MRSDSLWCKLSFWCNENALKLDYGDGCTTLNLLKIVHFKQPNLIAYKLYHNDINNRHQAGFCLKVHCAEP